MGTPELRPSLLTDGPSYSFDRVAAEYEETRYLPPQVADALARQVTAHLGPHDWVLDAGVGTGRLGRSLSRAHPGRVVGVDISRAMMARMTGKQRADRPHLALADLRALPFADGAFAAVLAVHVFHLIPAWETAVREVWRVVRPGGGMLVIGKEERGSSPVRDHYLAEAARRGVLPPNPGATTVQALRVLQSAGGIITEQRPASLAWSHQVSARATIAMLERRTYSVLWAVPADDHRELLEGTRRWAEGTLGSLDAQETYEARMVLYEARKL